jgi:RND family efflux transporter MFP subunit
VSQVRPDIDLGGLARASDAVPPPKRSKLRIFVPLAILLAFGAILVSTLGDLWKGSVEVTTVRPRVVDSSSTAAAGVALFQAAGWIEPDPFAIEVTALAAGVVREVLVQPSDAVKAGDVVARLIADDAQLACDSAEAMLAESRADLARAEAELRAAQQTFDNALDVVQAHEVAKAELAGRSSEAEQRSQAAISAEAQVVVAQEEAKLQRELADSGAVGPRQVELADAKVAEAKAELAKMRAEAALAQAEVLKSNANLTRAERDRQLRIGDSQRLETARAMVDVAKAKVDAVQVTCDEAKLRLSRMEVRAPSDGIVLERLAAPGTTIGEGSAVVCTLYDPASIRVRVDIPQGEVGKVGAGMKAEVLADSRPGKPYHGEVIRLVHKADIQKVTLQVHVRLEDADALVRPEMLVQARFLASGAGAGAASRAATIVLVPARLLVDVNSLWLVEGASRTAVLRRVQVGARVGEEVEVQSGVNASDKLIDAGRERVREGVRLSVQGEGAP